MFYIIMNNGYIELPHARTEADAIAEMNIRYTAAEQAELEMEVINSADIEMEDN